MYISGQWIQAENNAVFDVFNPATEEALKLQLEACCGALDIGGRVFILDICTCLSNRSIFFYGLLVRI